MGLLQNSKHSKKIGKNFHMAFYHMDQVTEKGSCLMVCAMKSSQVKRYPPSSIRCTMKCFIAFVSALLVYKTAIVYSATEFMRMKSQQMRWLYGNTVHNKIQNPALMTVHIIWSIRQLVYWVFHLAHNFTPEPNALLTITWSNNEMSGFVFWEKIYFFLLLFMPL